MSLFSRTIKVDAGEILTSELHDESSFYERFLEDMEHAKKSLYLESPFISYPRGSSLLPYFEAAIERGIKVTILTRYPNFAKDTQAGEAYTVIQALKTAGVKVRYSSPVHHRKLAIFDNTLMYEGSLNILSHVRSEEMMRRFDSTDLVRQTRKFLKI